MLDAVQVRVDPAHLTQPFTAIAIASDAPPLIPSALPVFDLNRIDTIRQ